jgi:hypothetical protein
MECDGTTPWMTGYGRSALERIDQSLRVDETQARQFSDSAHGMYELPACQQVINFGFARLVQEGDQHLARPAVGFLLGFSRYADRTGP